MTPDTLNGVFAVPPLARQLDATRAIDFEQNSRIVRSIANGGITRFIYGGNAFLYHLTLHEYQQLLEWQTEIKRDGLWLIPSAGPSYGRLIDQAKLSHRSPSPCVMTLPCADPRNAAGLERGLREFCRGRRCSPDTLPQRRNQHGRRSDGASAPTNFIKHHPIDLNLPIG